MGVLDKIVRKASEKTLARSQHEVAESAKAVQVPVIAALPPVRVLGVSAHDLTAELDLFLDETGGKRSIKTPINYLARAVLLAAMQDDPVLGIQTWKQEHREWFLTATNSLAIEIERNGIQGWLQRTHREDGGFVFSGDINTPSHPLARRWLIRNYAEVSRTTVYPQRRGRGKSPLLPLLRW